MPAILVNCGCLSLALSAEGNPRILFHDCAVVSIDDFREFLKCIRADVVLRKLLLTEPPDDSFTRSSPW